VASASALHPLLDRADRDYFRGATNQYHTTKRAA
jgi:hypothetical protein